MRDIAARVGVSHVTVSYALRGMPRVSPALRERICNEARKMGYSADPMLRALSTYKRINQRNRTCIQSALAWLCCWDSSEAMQTRKLTSDLTADNGRNAAATGALAARLLAGPEGDRIAFIETGGWDTHSGQKGRLNAITSRASRP